MWAGDDLPVEYMYWIERDGVAREIAIPPETITVNLEVRNVESEASSSAPLSSVAAFLVLEGLQQAPFLVTGSQVASGGQ